MKYTHVLIFSFVVWTFLFSPTLAFTNSESIVEKTQALLLQLEQGDKTAHSQLLAIKDKQAFPVFLEAITNSETQVRRTAVYMLRYFKKNDVLPPLATILKDDPDAKVRSTAALSLGLLGNKEAGGYLLQGLDDPNDRVVQMVIRALGVLKYPDAIDMLKAKLQGDNEDDWLIQSEAAKALQKITGQDWTQGIHKCHPDFRIRDIHLTTESTAKSAKFLTTTIPQMIREATTIQAIQDNSLYYIGYWNALSSLQGYHLKQEVRFQKLHYDFSRHLQQAGGIPEVSPEEVKKAYEHALEAYYDFLENTCWLD